jgi:hypothetical protein
VHKEWQSERSFRQTAFRKHSASEKTVQSAQLFDRPERKVRYSSGCKIFEIFACFLRSRRNIEGCSQSSKMTFPDVRTNMTIQATFSVDLAKCEVIQIFFLNDTEKIITIQQGKFWRVFQRKTITRENFQVAMFCHIISTIPANGNGP